MTIPILTYRATGRDRLPVDLTKLVPTKLQITAASGGGKSWAIRNLAEEVFGKVPVLIIDPEGEFFSLREKYDYVLAAVRGGDVEASVKTAPILARRLIELGASAVIDLFELKPDEKRRFVKVFLATLLALPRELWKPTIVIIDEIQLFAPEKGYGESEALETVVDFASRARKRGFCLVGATQRIAKFNKDVSASLHNKLIGLNTLDVDMERAAKELGFNKEGRDGLRKLEPGQFYAYGPAIAREVTLVRTGPVETTHPEAGQTIAVAAVPASKKVKALIASSLADLPQEAEEEARTSEDLRRQNADLSRQLKALERTAASTRTIVQPDEQAVARAVRREFDAGEKRVRAVQRRAEQFADTLGKGLTRLAHSVGDIEMALGVFRVDIGQIKTEESAHTKNDRLIDDAKKFGTVAVLPEKRQMTPGWTARKLPAVSLNSNLSRGQQNVLNALAELELLGVEAASRHQLGMVAGYNLTGGSGAQHVADLGSMGLVEVGNGVVKITDAGRDAASTEGVPSSLEELHERVLRKLSSGQRKIAEHLIAIYPEAISRADLGEATEYNLTGGSGAQHVADLVTVGAAKIPRQGAVVASDLLFPESLR